MSEIKSELILFINQIHNGGYCFINPKELVFEENPKMNCFYCGKYAENWKCPPNLPKLDYKKMVNEYDFGLFIYNEWDTSGDKDYDIIRNESSLVIHRVLLKIEKWLWEHNISNSISFGAGSCKLCKDGCGKDKCNNPYNARSPLEAIGVNVIKSARKCGIEVRFHAKKIMRIGLVLFQEENYL